MKKTTLPLYASTVLLGLAASSSAAVIYNEDFSVDSNSSASDVGWSYYEESTGTDQSSTIRFSGGDTGIDADYDSFLMKGNSTPGQEHLLVTTEPGTHSLGSLQSIQSTVGIWRNRNDSTDPTFFIAIKAGGNWYASTTSATIDATNAPSDDNLADGNQLTSNLSVDLSTETWRDLNFTAGSNLSIGGTAASQPSITDNVTDYGIFLASHDLPQWMGVDDFSVTTAAVPEPTSSALLGLGGLALILRRRK